MRTCKSCEEAKPESEFYVDRSRPDGLSFYCKPCTKAKVKNYGTRPPRKQASTPGMKLCARCKTEKPVADFSKSSLTYDGLDKRCKTCCYELHEAWRLKNLDKAAEQGRRWRANNPERFKDHCRKTNYGTPLGWYAETLAAQNGKCAICSADEPGGKGSFHVDHCHDTGKVRALLCTRCNLALGHLRHDPDLAEKVKLYLLNHKAPREGAV